MNTRYKFIPSSELSNDELAYKQSPEEVIKTLSRERNAIVWLNTLPSRLKQIILLSGEKQALKTLRRLLSNGQWVAVDAQNQHAQNENKLAFTNAYYKRVTDDVVLAPAYTYVPVEPMPEHKIVVEVAGQSPAANMALYLSKSEDLPEKITQPQHDRTLTHRSLAVFDRLEPAPRDLYLNINMQGHPNPLSLRLAEGIMPVGKDADMPEWDNVLVPMRPLAYLSGEKSKLKSAELKAGYLYVFWKNKLWRELFITDRSYYQDIDVEYYRNLEQQEKRKQQPEIISREPEGFVQQHVLLPYKIKGVVQEGEDGLKLLFCPHALSFTQIENYEKDSDKLDSLSTALDDIKAYSQQQSFSEQAHISDASSPTIHAVTSNDMSWLSDNAVVINSLKETNIAIAYVDGHNGGLRINVDIGIDEGITPPMLSGCFSHDDSEWQQTKTLTPSTDSDRPNWQTAIFYGFPKTGTFSFHTINTASDNDVELIYSGLSYSEFVSTPQPEADSEANEDVTEAASDDSDLITDEEKKAFLNNFNTWDL